jgi:hypothetical protein
MKDKFIINSCSAMKNTITKKKFTHHVHIQSKHKLENSTTASAHDVQVVVVGFPWWLNDDMDLFIYFLPSVINSSVIGNNIDAVVVLALSFVLVLIFISI